MFCSKCGAANNEDHRFCQNCSHPLAGSDMRSRKRGNRKSPIRTILLILALIAVAFVLLVAFSPDDPKAAAATPGDASAAGSSSSAAPMQETAADSATPAEQDADATAKSADANTAEPGAANADDASMKATDEDIGEAEAAAADGLIEVGDIREKDVFDWNAATDEEKNKMAFACQMYWYAGGVTGEPVDISAADLAKKIGEALSGQSYVFETACALYDLDPSQWNDTVE